MFKPFFINHNLCQEEIDISNIQNFWNAVAGNTGNSFIAHSIINILYGKTVKIEGITNIWQCNLAEFDTDKINAEYTHVVLIMQDQIRNHDSYYKGIDCGAIANFLEKIKIPLITFSLGCNAFSEGELSNLHNTVDPEMKRILSIISHKTPQIGVRGNYTAEILEKLGIKNVAVTGCPSFFTTQSKKIRKNPLTKIATNGGMQTKFLANTSHYHIMQDLYESKFVEYIAFGGNYPDIIHETDKYQETIMKNGNLRIFSSMDDWAKFVRTMDLVVGTRVHCGIMAINQGTPAIITNSDFRAKEMCQLFKIPLHPEFYHTTNLQEAFEKADYKPLETHYPILKENFGKYLKSHGLNVDNIKKSGVKAYKQPRLKIANVNDDDSSTLKARLKYYLHKIIPQ